MKLYTLPKSERLYLRESIGELFAKGKSFTAFPYRVVFLISDEADKKAATEASPAERSLDERQGRCAIMAVAPKKRFKHAVDRNHVKRLTREAYRLQKLPLLERLEAAGKTMEVAFVYVDNKFITFDETYKTIGRAIAKLTKNIG